MSGTLTLTVCVVIESMGGSIIHVAPLAERGWMRVGEEGAALVELGVFLTQQLTSADPADVTRLVAFFCEADTAIRQGEVAVVVAECAAPVSVEYACIALEGDAADLARVARRERKNSVPVARSLAGEGALGEWWSRAVARPKCLMRFSTLKTSEGSHSSAQAGRWTSQNGGRARASARDVGA